MFFFNWIVYRQDPCIVVIQKETSTKKNKQINEKVKKTTNCHAQFLLLSNKITSLIHLLWNMM